MAQDRHKGTKVFAAFLSNLFLSSTANVEFSSCTTEDVLVLRLFTVTDSTVDVMKRETGEDDLVQNAG
jgi:hypothetical protein